MEVAVVVVIAALIVASLVLLAAGRIRRVRPPASAPAGQEQGGEVAETSIDLEPADPDAPAIRRLVVEAAEQTFAAMPSVGSVVIRSRAGVALGRFERRSAVAPARFASTPAIRPLARSNGPRLAGHLAEELTDEESDAPFAPRAAPEMSREIRIDPEPERPLAESFDLPPSVRRRLGPSADAVAIVRAILEAGGHRVERAGDLLRCGEDVVIVLGASPGLPVTHDALNHAYHRFASSGARSGIVVTPGHIDLVEMRRREILAPALRHAGAEGIQRMADAVAAGADPLAFAAGPPLVTSRR